MSAKLTTMTQIAFAERELEADSDVALKTRDTEEKEQDKLSADIVFSLPIASTGGIETDTSSSSALKGLTK